MYFLILLCVSFFSLSQGAADSPKIMRYEDIVELERPKQVAISPDASRVAFVVQTADIQNNRNISTVYLWKEGATEKLWELDEVRKITWQGELLYISGKKGEEYQILASNGFENQVLLSTPKFISAFVISEDGGHLYYTQTVYMPESELEMVKAEGYVYRWGTDNCATLANKEYSRCEREEVWHLNLASGQPDIVTSLSYENWIDLPSYITSYGSLITDIQVSKDNRHLALDVHRLGNPKLGEVSYTDDLIVWDLEKKVSYRLRSDSLAVQTSPCWISGEELAFQEMDFGRREFKIWIWNAVTQSASEVQAFSSKQMIQSITWNEETRTLIAECAGSLSMISWDTQKIESLELPPSLFHFRLDAPVFSFDHNLRFFSSILEDSNTPPQVVIYDRETKITTPISKLNPKIENYALGPVEKITVRAENGISAEGYLVHPVHEIKGKRYPLILASYGFHGQTFIADAEWHSSFPAQTLASEGYFILLLNQPTAPSGQRLVGDPEKARQHEGWNVLAVFERAVELLDEQGLIDRSKVGIYGWSYGAFVAEFCISHSDKFHVACIGEGGDYNPGVFWMGGRPGKTGIFDNMFGGPPWGPSLQAYLGYSPFFRVDQIHTPLLMEFSDIAIGGLEMYVPLRYLNVPAELVVYDKEAHNFEKPKARIASMARKVDWFNYWLLGKRDPEKWEQYDRWDTMREKFEETHRIKD